jgi:hypothetical protein
MNTRVNLIRFIYYIYNYRLLYYLPMEKMEKLIELLNEYDKYRWEKRRVYWWTKWKVELDVNLIISKKFWFIKRLIENYKIDLWEKLFNLTKNDNRKSIICDLDNNDFSWEDTFLMLLSISDTPIEDLISYLK